MIFRVEIFLFCFEINQKTVNKLPFLIISQNVKNREKKFKEREKNVNIESRKNKIAKKLSKFSKSCGRMLVVYEKQIENFSSLVNPFRVRVIRGVWPGVLTHAKERKKLITCF